MAGRGIFHYQEVQNVLQLGGEQVLVVTWVIHSFVLELADAVGLPV